MRKFISLTETAEVLGISRISIVDCVRTGDLPAVQIGKGRKYMVSIDYLEQKFGINVEEALQR